MEPFQKGGALALLAAQLCQNPEFREWLNGRQIADLVLHVETERDAAVAIRLICGVQSRAELDHNDQAGKRFHERIRRPFAQRHE